MKNGYYTLPLILAMEKNQAVFTPYLEKKTEINDQDIEAVNELIHKYQGIEQAEAIAERFTDRALAGIKKLPNCEERDILYDVTATLLNRNN
jgi:heptaprenyl diphosphate synthase